MTANPLIDGTVRPCLASDTPKITCIINAAADAYRGVIPADCWHDPYMPEQVLAAELAAGVVFWGLETAHGLVGVMGLQRRGGVDLIRHAYVLPSHQGAGVGATLLDALCRDQQGPLLVGTWQAADWAVRFYRRHGFNKVPRDAIGPLLRTFWAVPDRQIETSVVLSMPSLTARDATALVAASRPRASAFLGDEAAP